MNLTALKQLYGTTPEGGIWLAENKNNDNASFELTEKQIEYYDSIKNPPKYSAPTYEAVRLAFWEFYKFEVAKGGKTPIITAELAVILKNCCLWLIDDKSGNYAANKGLFFYGSKGTGKTAILKAIQKTANYYKMPKSFLVSEAPKIFDDVQLVKDFNISQYYKETRCFDDIGFSEPHINSFGNIIRPMEVILRNRYNSFMLDGMLTHVSTNLDSDGLKVHFDERVLDRFTEMFNIVLFKGDSFRRIKPI